jgi:hypothetical protein
LTPSDLWGRSAQITIGADCSGEIMKLLATGEAMQLPVEISARRITACLATTAMISS